MVKIAQGTITLNSVNDAFTVYCSPNSLVINTRWNGEDPDYNNAYADLTLYRGEIAMPFEIIDITASNISKFEVIDKSQYIKRIKINQIPNDILTGHLNIQIKYGNEFTTWVNLPLSVVRETSMLDWILDWEGREKTEIAGEYIITPKIFVGKSENEGQLTGTYIGPAFDGSNKVGVFGYFAGQEIFHIDNTGGMIGGWSIENGGIQTSDGVLKILAEGTIISSPDNKTAWQLNKDGSASFAGGNVHFYADGNADFTGTITSVSGKIGGWNIGNHSLFNSTILIDSNARFIGVRKLGNTVFRKEPSYEDFYNCIKKDGGIAILSQNNVSFGIECWLPIGHSIQKSSGDGFMVFSLGYNNMIAGWNFDGSALYRGERNNTKGQNTSSEGSITIGSNGLRGMNWYIDCDGDISFVSGLLQFDKTGGTIAGWTLTSKQFSAYKAALVSDSEYTGLYLSNTPLPASYTSYENHIISKGGIFLTATDTGPRLHARNSTGEMIFQLSMEFGFVGGWYFSEKGMFTGTNPTPKGEFASVNNITISPDGLRGYKFRLEASGAGAIAGGKIAWDDNGELTLDSSVTISWAQITGTNVVTDKLTKIDSSGIYTGTINADNITTGTLSSERINTDELLSNGEKWALQKDGSGYLADKKINWNANGVLHVGNCLFSDVQISGSLTTPFRDGHFSYSDNGEAISVATLGLQNNNCVVIPGVGAGVYTSFNVPFSPTYNGFRAIIINHDWNGVLATGPICASAPSGAYFHEDGESMSHLIINPHEAVEMIGVGEGETFKGWLVLNRKIYGHPNTSIGDGFTVKAMYIGVIKYDTKSKEPKLKLQKKWDQITDINTENKKLLISYPTDLRGNITVQIPKGVFSSPDKYEVFVSTCKNGVDNVHGYACVGNKTADSFEIWASDDTTWNSIDITFMIIGTWNMYA